jgi:hypothetical protein
MKEIITHVINSAGRTIGGATDVDVKKFYITSTFDYKNSLAVEASGEITSGDNTYTYEVVIKVNNVKQQEESNATRKSRKERA